MARVAVIGGGLVGSAAAVWLLADGHKVTLFERSPDARPASTGGAGLIALPMVSPLARPGILKQVPGWLVDPLGPLSIRARDLPRMMPYLMRYLTAARPGQVERATAAMAGLMKTALRDHQELARRGGLSGHMRHTGALSIFETEAGFRSAMAEFDDRRRYGVTVEEVAPEEARAAVPALAGAFVRAVFEPDYWTVTSPNAILQALRQRVLKGGSITVRDVVGLRPDTDEIGVITSEGADYPFDAAVVAGGVWSRDIVKSLRLKVALEAERGYNTTFPDPRIEFPIPVFFAEHGFVATPLSDGLRVGGAVELASPDAPPNFSRAAAMRKKMRRVVPDLPETGGREWMGCRPATPDSLPVIGPDPRDHRIIYAFGHGHLGLTLSAATARHIAALIAGRDDPVLEPFGIERFQ